MRDQDGAQVPVAKESRSAHPIITNEGRLPCRTLATLVAGGQKKYLDSFGPVVEGFDQLPFADLDVAKCTVGRRLPPSSSRSWARGACVLPPELCARPAPDLRRSADRRRPHRPPVRIRAMRDHPRHHGPGEGPRRRLSAPASLPRQGHDRRQPWVHLRLNARDGRSRRARRGAGGTAPTRAAHQPPPQAEAGRDQGSIPLSDRGGPWRMSRRLARGREHNWSNCAPRR